MKKIDFIFRIRKAKSFPHWEDRFYCSYDGGKTWQDRPVYNDFYVMIKHFIGCFTVDHLLKPPAHLELCFLCRNRGKVGVMRFNRYSYGSEKQTKVWFEEDAEISGDVSYGVRYRIDKCDRCGNEESDYG